MKNLLLTTAAAALISAPALAQMTDYSNLIRTRDITGGNIYTMNEAYDEGSWGVDTYYTEADAGWNDIGEIEDVILNREGKMIGIVAEVGGFLDIGDKHVMLPVEDVKLVAVDDKSYSYVTRLSEEQLEEMESVDEGWWD
ncbi:PRC-barrel domain-containing protein [Martelella sp. FLE1502]